MGVTYYSYGVGVIYSRHKGGIVHVLLIWNVMGKQMIMVIDDDRHKNNFSLLVSIYDC